MNREQFAEKIRWSFIVWVVGLVNVLAMLPQLHKIVTTQKTEDLSLGMIWLYLIVQITLSLDGFFKRNRMLMVCMALSAVVSILIIGSVLYFRNLTG